MRVAKVSAIVGVVAGTALVLSACGGGSGAKKASAPAASGASGSQSASAAPGSPSAAPSASATGPDGGKYLAGFMQPNAFEHGLAHVSGYPNWDNGDTGDVHGLAALDCYTLENGGEASGSTMQAYDLMTSSGANQDFATQKAYTFNPGDAVKMMQYIELRIDNDCAAFDHTPSSGGAKTHTTMTEKSVPGLGDQAVQVTATDTPAGGASATLSALLVRYGDDVIYVSFSNGDANNAKSFDLVSREKTIAQNLHLG